MKQILRLLFFALTRLDATVPSTSVVKIVPDPVIPGMDMRLPLLHLSDSDTIWVITKSMRKKQLVDSITDPKRSINDKLALLYKTDARFDPNLVRAPDLMAGGLTDHDFFAGF